MRRLSFAGTPSAIGEAFGEICRAEIAELYRLRVLNALAQAKEYGGRTVDEGALLRLSERCLAMSEAYHPEGFAELSGIARGSGLSVPQIFAMNGLTDLRDVLAYGDPLAFGPAREEGCSSFIVQSDSTEDDHVLIGQTWDLATDNMPFVVLVERRPTGRPATWSMTTTGCLSLIGMNEAGISIGTTNLRSTDSHPGVGYLEIIHRALQETALEGAQASIETAPRAGAHYYALASADDRAMAVECTALRATTTSVERGYFVHCNHFVDPANRALEASVPASSTLCRQSRMTQLLGSASRPIRASDLMRFLADHQGGPDAICRHDVGGVSSNGSVIMEPGTKRGWVCHGPACSGTWVSVSFALPA